MPAVALLAAKLISLSVGRSVVGLVCEPAACGQIA